MLYTSAICRYISRSYCICTFKKKFVTPTSEASTLTSVGLETEYEPIVMTGVATQLIAGDISKLNASYITEQLKTSVVLQTVQATWKRLLRYQQLLIQQARSNLRSKYPEPVQQ